MACSVRSSVKTTINPSSLKGLIFRSSGLDKLIQTSPNNIAFGLFSSEEIKQLSVVNVVSPLTFNALGHPLPHGLYDPAMGPCDSTSICTTCSHNTYRCTGHMGHIELPLPIVNPLFHKTVQNILRMSCLACHTILIPSECKYLLICQLKLLDAGFVTAAQDLECYFNNLNFRKNKVDEHRNVIIDSLENHVQGIMSTDIPHKNFQHGKGLDKLRSLFVKNAVKSCHKGKKCPNCKEAWKKTTVVQNKIMSASKVVVSEKLKNISITDENDIVVQQFLVSPAEIKAHLTVLWQNDQTLMKALIPVLKSSRISHPTDLLLLMDIPVTPTKTRPINIADGMVVEHPQNSMYKSILNDCLTLRSILLVMSGNTKLSLSEERKELVAKVRGESNAEKLQFTWQQLQIDIDTLMDKDMNKLKKLESHGLKQVIEKKDGLIRKHMMGKRVNFAARSVITPDPNLNIEEVGIPEDFAKKLTYPAPVTEWNVTEIRKLVINGPDVHPGAVFVENKDGKVFRIPPNDPITREGIAKRLLTPGEKVMGIKIVHRHLLNGDRLLLNRQPTLHKPSIMAHKARILKGEKTLRLHYANCKSYNADFDGDEMNAHFPQNEIARSECTHLVNVVNQYLVPKDGTPLSGLIQDHMVSGVRLSVRGKFFNREDYMQLVFQGLSNIQEEIKILSPAILKPVQLWSGKQVISTIIINVIPKGKVPINLKSTAKISFKAWEKMKPRPWKAGGTPFIDPKTMTEAEVVIRNGELLCGVLDKTHYGATPYSLVHCLYELYGGACSSRLLSSFAKLFTAFLQKEGFTLGVEDILVIDEANKERKKLIKEARSVGHMAACNALDLPLETKSSVLNSRLSEAYRESPKFCAVIDRQYKLSLDRSTNNINSSCLPAGLLRSFPQNNLQLMVQSGAKGSTVNTMQISCLLGQIELEGKRPPIMISGRSLPSFPPYDTSPRAGGFIDSRFMTGIQPQEFFFHCMAGREGLIDTAVKTSRSGYLQRCLVKHLEGLTVNYDMTVRDSDGCVMQFAYGEDGMDILKSQFIKKEQMKFLAENIDVIYNKITVQQLKEDSELDEIKKRKKHIKSWQKRNDESRMTRSSPFSLFTKDMKEQISPKRFKTVVAENGRSQGTRDLIHLWQGADDEIKHKYTKQCRKCPDPVTADFQAARHFSSISESLELIINDYLANQASRGSVDKSVLRDMLSQKAMMSLCPPGEPVGLLAAQSIGEPSTQMTLNTFHFAGRGEMNVTLGIPRLREILMMATKAIKTPTVEVPFLQHIEKLESKANNLRKHLTRVSLEDVLQSVSVSERMELSPVRQQVYILRFQFLPKESYQDDSDIKPRHVLRHVEKKFLTELVSALRKRVRKKAELISTGTDERGTECEDKEGEERNVDVPLLESGNRKTIWEKINLSDDKESSDEDPERDDDATSRKRARQKEDQEYDEPGVEENEFRDVDNDEEEEELDAEVGGSGIEDAEGRDSSSREDKERKEEERERQNWVLQSNESVQGYSFDVEKEEWCEVTLSYALSLGHLDFANILRELAPKSVITEVPNIKRGFTFTNTRGQLSIKTDGLNMAEIWRHHRILDLDQLYSNDVHAIAETYGIEAAARVIVKEVQDVFKVYGITIDARHLTLIADYMTFDGTFQPLNRTGMKSCASPLQQMSFESSLDFLRTAVTLAKRDDLCSPSGRLIMGLPVLCGTGSFELRQKLI